MKKYSSISNVIERMKKQMLTDRNLKKRVERLAGRMSKSQEQTPLSIRRSQMQLLSDRIRRHVVVALLVAFCFSGCVSRPPLHEAAWNNDVEKIHSLVSKGVHVDNAKFKTGIAITAAIYQDHYGVLCPNPRKVR